jgi:hypothetical protein
MSQPLGPWSSPSEELLPSRAAVLDAGRPSAFARRLIPLRPLAAGELLDGSVVLTRAFPRALLAAGAVLAIVAAVIDLVITLTVVGPISVDRSAGRVDSQTAQDLLGAAGISGLATLFVTAVTGVVMLAVVTLVLGHVVRGEATSLTQTWAELRPVAGRVLGLALVVAAAVEGSFLLGLGAFIGSAALGGGGLLLGVPVLAAGCLGAVWLYVHWALAASVMVLEKQSVRASLGRSRVLVRGSFWRVLGLLLLALVISYVVATVIQIPFALLGYDPLSGLNGTYQFTRLDAVLGAVASALANTLIVPFSAGVRSLLYLDRRMRAEALDLDLRLRTQ